MKNKNKFPIGTLLYSSAKKIGIVLGYVKGQYLCNTVYWFNEEYYSSSSDETVRDLHGRYLELEKE